MPRYLMLAFNGPNAGEGDAEALEHWYATDHLPGILEDKDVISARRYRLQNGNLPGMEKWPCVSAYEIETEDMGALMERLQAKLGDVHPAMDRTQSATVLAVLESSGEG